MIKYFAIVLLLFIGCAGTDVVDKPKPEKKYNSAQAKKEAMNHFINGSLLEAKGDYPSAVNEYQRALAFDESSGIYFALAKSYYMMGKYSLALQNGRKAVQHSPEEKDYYSLLGDIYIITHQADSASYMYEKIVALDSTDISALYRLAGAYEKTKPSQSITIYNKILVEAGPEWSVLVRLAELNEKLGNIDEAADNIRQLTEMDPGNAPIKKVLVELYTKAKNYSAAEAVLNEIIEIEPEDFEARERKAQLFIEQNEWIKAGEEYKYLLSLPQVSLDAKIRIGAAYFIQSLKDSTLLPTAKSIFTNIDKDTTDWQVKLFLGGIALNERNDPAAERYFSEVINLAQYNPEGWIRLGALYFDNARYEEAIKLLTEAVEIYPQDFGINLLLGLSYAQSEKYPEAKPFLKTAVDANRTEVNALSAYAYTLSQLKESEEAISYLNKALKLAPGDVNLWGTLGLIYNSLEMWEECDSTYEHALRLDSANALINNNYAYSLAERDLQLERALEMVKISIEAEPHNSSYLDTIGWIYFKLEQYNEAEEYLQKAIDVAGDRPVLLDHMGDIKFMKGDKDAAMEFWKKSYSADSSNEKVKLKIEKGEI
jgi:tetratricopeptide (TPR) repeat protein